MLSWPAVPLKSSSFAPGRIPLTLVLAHGKKLGRYIYKLGTSVYSVITAVKEVKMKFPEPML